MKITSRNSLTFTRRNQAEAIVPVAHAFSRHFDGCYSYVGTGSLSFEPLDISRYP